MSVLTRMGDAGDDFLDRVCPGDWLSTAISHSKAKRLAARIVPTAMWLLLCIYLYSYLFIGSLPVLWDNKASGYFAALLFTLFFVSFLMVLVALIASVVTCESRTANRYLNP